MQNIKAVQERQEDMITLAVRKPALITRFAGVLGGYDKANQFLASLVSAVNGNTSLQRCDVLKLIGCAMQAASLNLDINPNLGFASIVPYKNKDGEQIPQFQIGWKGFVQLAMRTGKYRTMNVTEVYKDEFDSFDPFKGELRYHNVTDGDRDNDRRENIVGYAFYFELVSGYSKMAYMSKESITAHAKRHSKAYRNDLKNDSHDSLWSTEEGFDAMAKKTITKLTLSKWGVLSTQMIVATKTDQGTMNINDFDDGGNARKVDYIDNNDKPETAEPKAKAKQIEASQEKSAPKAKADDAEMPAVTDSDDLGGVSF